jgi:hypothetical protein
MEIVDTADRNRLNSKPSSRECLAVPMFIFYAVLGCNQLECFGRWSHNITGNKLPIALTVIGLPIVFV